MCTWTLQQEGIIKAAKEGNLKSLNLADRYKCPTCLLILYDDQVDHEAGARPVCRICKTPVVEMCPLDHNHCSHPIVVGIEYCPICDKAICPTCGSHDVTQVSRVTGYLSDVGGWNSSKSQELRDRCRYDIIESEPVLVIK